MTTEFSKNPNGTYSIRHNGTIFDNVTAERVKPLLNKLRKGPEPVARQIQPVTNPNLQEMYKVPGGKPVKEDKVGIATSVVTGAPDTAPVNAVPKADTAPVRPEGMSDKDWDFKVGTIRTADGSYDENGMWKKLPAAPVAAVQPVPVTATAPAKTWDVKTDLAKYVTQTSNDEGGQQWNNFYTNLSKGAPVQAAFWALRNLQDNQEIPEEYRLIEKLWKATADSGSGTIQQREWAKIANAPTIDYYINWLKTADLQTLYGAFPEALNAAQSAKAKILGVAPPPPVPVPPKVATVKRDVDRYGRPGIHNTYTVYDARGNALLTGFKETDIDKYMNQLKAAGKLDSWLRV